MEALKRTTCMKKEEQTDPYANTLKLDNTLGLKSIITYNEEDCKAIMKEIKNKFLMYCEEEIEENVKAFTEKINKINENKKKEGYNIVKEINNMNWDERNMIELLFPGANQKSIYIFNPLLNKVEQILIEMKDEFPGSMAICNRLPYCFCSGGKTKNGDESEELNEFFTLKRTGLKNFEKIILPTMLEEKSNHCLFEIPYLKGICALGGVGSDDVEIFKLEDKKWENLPILNYKREGASCCVVNDIFVYCFFGYDSENCEYLTNIEKLDLEQNIQWDVLQPYGNKTFMKKKFSGCIHYRQNFEEYIFIVGGINVLNNESQDLMFYDAKDNTIEKKQNNLPYKSSFNSNSFIKLPNGLLTNLTVDYQLLQFEPLGQYIFGIREK